MYVVINSARWPKIGIKWQITWQKVPEPGRLFCIHSEWWQMDALRAARDVIILWDIMMRTSNNTVVRDAGRRVGRSISKESNLLVMSLIP
jgi:hypothetical protein